MSNSRTRELPAPDMHDSRGRKWVAAIGIDRYRHWPRLANAVHDAEAISSLLQRAGFELFVELLDDRATSSALRSLVHDDLKCLGPDDSLVLFYAGHGGTRMHADGIATGHLIPVDSAQKAGEWIALQDWLGTVSLLQAKHILVILDTCYSGIALAPITRWPHVIAPAGAARPAVAERRSRVIITSALDSERASDQGQVPGHSLFTGCLIQALTRNSPDDPREITVSKLALTVQERVKACSHDKQTPISGVFGLHEHGELKIPLVEPGAVGPNPAAARPHAPGPITAVAGSEGSTPPAILHDPHKGRLWLVAMVVACAALVGAGGWLIVRHEASRSVPLGDAGANMARASLDAPPIDASAPSASPREATAIERPQPVARNLGSVKVAAPTVPRIAVRPRPPTGERSMRVAEPEPEPRTIAVQVTETWTPQRPDVPPGTHEIDRLVASAGRASAKKLQWLGPGASTHGVVLRIDSRVSVSAAGHGIHEVEQRMRCLTVTLSIALEYTASAHRDIGHPATVRRCHREYKAAYDLAIADLTPSARANLTELLSHKQEAP